jgi:hypothetical protein
MTTIENPDGDGRVRVSFITTGPPATVEHPWIVGGSRLTDTAVVRYDEGEREGLTSIVLRPGRPT